MSEEEKKRRMKEKKAAKAAAKAEAEAKALGKSTQRLMRIHCMRHSATDWSSAPER
jgi:hypothetical protein